MFQHGEVQTLIQQHRALAFQIIVNLMSHKLDVLRLMKEEFSVGYIHMIDGERDPRNLLTIFQLTPLVINAFPIGVCCEELFDVTSCYFPVDFTPPPGQAFQITKEELADQLRAAMAATPRFSQYCLPLLIEKISSDLQSAKQDSFKTLVSCCNVYGVEDLRPSMRSLTQLVVREAMLSPSSKTEELALEAITALAHCLAAPVDGVIMYTDVDEYTLSIIKDCKHHLFEPEHALAASSVKILKALVCSHNHVADLVLTDALPIILEKLNSSQEDKKKGFYLDTIKQLFGSCPADVLKHKRLALPSVLSYLVHGSETVLTASVQCMATLSDSTADSSDSVCAKLLEMAHGSESTSLRKEASQCLAVFLADKTSDRSESILSPLCGRLTFPSSLEPSTFNTIDILVQHCGADRCLPILQPLLDCCQLCAIERRDLVERCLESLCCLVCSFSSPLKGDYIKQVMDFFMAVSSTDLTKGTRLFVQQLVIGLVNRSDENLLNEIARAILDTDVSSQLMSTAVQSFLCTLPSKFLDEVKILDKFAALAIDSTSDQCADSCQICASVVNKSNSPDALLERLYPGACPPSTIDPSHLPLFIWVSKALLLRGHRLSHQFLLQMIECLKQPSLAPLAADGFEVLLRDYQEVLSSQQNCTRKLMYKQRTFATAFPLLHDMLTTVQPELLASVHIAITNLIRHVPQQVIANDKQMLLSVMIRLLGSEDSLVLLKSLEVIAEGSDSTLLAGHLDTLLPLLLKLTRYSLSMKVRMASLQCLATLSKVNITQLVPHIDFVIRGLLPAIDDKKRLVRNEAVKARNIWCLVRDGD
ncbi:MMS19 nucleotide excision repair protein homolog [Watersipora subatra]|uniref:MMS19 nucleotide excision repair protein homolog n=1 Tax=Watersipora subatra TaxID=2589382 RepID=UPI00355AF047